jgi:ABC-type Fe3+ transport system permease subunit
MRKAILILSAISFVCWSIAVAEIWTSIRIEQELFNGHLSGFFVVIAILFYLSAMTLFCIRMAQQHRVRKTQGMQITGRDLFRRIAGARPYQREARLELAVILSLPLCSLISHSIQLIVEYNSTSSFDFEKYQSLQNSISLTILLLWPLSTLLYALFSKDLQTLAKDKKRG